MKKRVIAVMTAMMLATTLLAGCGGGDAPSGGGDYEGETFVMRCAYDVPAGGSMARAIEKFEELVKADPELSQVIDVQLFPGGQLFAANETMDATLRGDVELGMFTTWYADSILPYSSTFDLPLLFNDVEQMIDFVENSELVKDVWAPFEEVGGHCFGGTVTGEYGILSAKKAVEKPEDVKGLLIRSVGDGSLTWLALGANPINMSAGDIFTGLQRGTIDAADIGPISVKDRNLYEVADHYLNTFFHSTLSIYVVNKDWWDQLPADVSAKLEDYMKEAISYCNGFVSEDMEVALKLMEENGITNYKPTSEERQAWKDSVQDVYQELGYDKMGAEFTDALLEWVENN